VTTHTVAVPRVSAAPHHDRGLLVVLERVGDVAELRARTVPYSSNRDTHMASTFPSVVHLSDAARNVLARCSATDTAVRLPDEQLDRALYEEVNDVLVRLGGKWKGGKAREHRFPHYMPGPLLAAVLDTGLMPPQNPLAFFPTPAPVVADMLEELGLQHFPDMGDQFWECLAEQGGMRILEPSAGVGGIADAIRKVVPRAVLECVELAPLNVSVLRAKGHTVFAQDFLTFTPSAPYAAIALNPPFNVTGSPRAYQEHIRHAHGMLARGGRLVAIAPPGFLTGTSSADRVFRDFVFEHESGEGATIPAGAFHDSGTDIATVMLTLHAEPTGRGEVNGWHCWHCWSTAVVEENNDSAYEAARATLTRRVEAGTLAGAFSAAGTPAALALDAHYDAVIAKERLRVVLLPECRNALRAQAEVRASELCDVYAGDAPLLAPVPEIPAARVKAAPMSPAPHAKTAVARPAPRVEQSDLFAA